MGLDAFYVGHLKGLGPVWQLTACDTRTGWTIAELYIGRPNSQLTAGFLDLLIDRLAMIGVVLSGVIVDGGSSGRRRSASAPGSLGRRAPDPATLAGLQRDRGTVRDAAAGVLQAHVPSRCRRRRPAAQPPAPTAPRAPQQPPPQPRQLDARTDPAPGPNLTSDQLRAELSPRSVVGDAPSRNYRELSARPSTMRDPASLHRLLPP